MESQQRESTMAQMQPQQQQGIEQQQKEVRGGEQKPSFGGSSMERGTETQAKNVWVVTDENYFPQRKIDAMSATQKDALLRPYRMTHLNGSPLDDSFTDTIGFLKRASGVRVVNLPVAEECDLGLTSTGKLKDKVDAVPYERALFRTEENVLINATSICYPLRLDSPIKEDDMFRSTPSPDLGRFIFANFPQFPSLANKEGRSDPSIKRPCMHLFIFGASGNRPLFVVERLLEEKSRRLRVFNDRLEKFGSIETVETFFTKTKIVIRPADEDVTLYTIKPEKKLQPKPEDFVINDHLKNKVGCITTRWINANATPPYQSQHPGHDVLFPTEASWPNRVMLIVAALYMDLLWID